MANRNTAARAIADVAQGVVLARVDIDAPAQRVFAALTTDELTQWWGSPELYRTTKFSIDLRVGGHWRTDGIGADGTEFHVAGKVLELEAPHLLSYSWKPSWENTEPSTVVYRLDELDGKTRLTVRHTGFADPASCANHANGWERVGSWLAAHFAAKAEGKFFLIRLQPPRPTFMQDMTAEEGAMMQAHSTGNRSYNKVKPSCSARLQIPKARGASASSKSWTKPTSKPSKRVTLRSPQAVASATKSYPWCAPSTEPATRGSFAAHVSASM